MEIDAITQKLISDYSLYLRNKGKKKWVRVLYLFNGTVPHPKYKRTVEFFESLKFVKVLFATMDGSFESRRVNLVADEMNLYDRFDLVINNALTQNIMVQAEAFRNIHHFVKEKCLMLHVLFCSEGWKDRSCYLYHKTFFEQLARQNDYNILKKKRRQCNNGIIMYGILEKTQDRIFTFNFALHARTFKNMVVKDF